MDDNTVDREFEKIALNEQIRAIDRELGRGSAPAGPHDKNPLAFFEKFLKPSEVLPDIDRNYVGR